MTIRLIIFRSDVPFEALCVCEKENKYGIQMTKAGVYVLWRPSDNTNPHNFVVKIGHTINLKKRFSNANTFIYKDEDRVGMKNIWCVFHSPPYVKYGLHILEQMIQQYYHSYRKPCSEFFVLPRYIDPSNDPQLMEYLNRYNIPNLTVYTSVGDIPETEK